MNKIIEIIFNKKFIIIICIIIIIFFLLLKNKNELFNQNIVKTYTTGNINELDTPYYKRFKPLEYNKDRAYYWRSDKLVEEGIRRNQDDLQQIQNLQTSFENETDEKKKKELQDELDLYKWRNSILESKDKTTGLSRDKRDIITDYYPEEIGQPRVWIERHSHLPNYSY